jgi:cytochrome c biogenesis protein
LDYDFKHLANEVIEYPLVNISKGNQNKVWLTWIANNNSLNEGIIAIIDNLEGYCSIYNETGTFLGNIELNETVNLNQPITFSEIISSTGLQDKTDPGIPIIYIGFFFLMLSTLVSYITYSQIWIIKKIKNFLLVGQQIVLFLILN